MRAEHFLPRRRSTSLLRARGLATPLSGARLVTRLFEDTLPSRYSGDRHRLLTTLTGSKASIKLATETVATLIDWSATP